METQTASTGASQFACTQCGAALTYAPGTTSLKCPYCGAEQEVAPVRDTVDEHSYGAYMALPRKPLSKVAAFVLKCRNCAASTETTNLSDACPFCAAPMVVDENAEDLVTPEAVVPFKVPKKEAGDHFRAWVKSRWFAPTALKKVGSTEKMHGMYLPHWTFDDHTTTRYRGERGEWYYVTVKYTAYENGKAVQRTRQERRTRWYPASGVVSRFFDDVVAPGTVSIDRKRLDSLGPWNLHEAVPYQPEYLSGYETERYGVEPEDGFADAYQQMLPVIHSDIRSDIGGDEQRIHSTDTKHDNVMFKLVLLPLWIAAYIYAGKTYQVFVNANTGEVSGERPYSKIKIFFAALAATLALLGGYFAYQHYGTSGTGYTGPSYDEPYTPPQDQFVPVDPFVPDPVVPPPPVVPVEPAPVPIEPPPGVPAEPAPAG